MESTVHEQELELLTTIAALKMEYLGIHMVGIIEPEDKNSQVIFKLSVPEKSIMMYQEYTSEELILEAIEWIMKILVKRWRVNVSDDNEKIIVEKIKATHKFQIEIRTGDIWTQEMGESRVKELTEELEIANQ